MPHFQIKLLEGKTEEQKQKLAKEVVKAAQSVIGYGDESFSVTIEDFTFDEWKNKVYPKDIVGRKDILYKEPGYNMDWTMSTETTTLTKEEIARIAAADDFRIAPYREDGATTGTPTFIWSVSVDDHLYVRAYSGTGSSWYRAALKQKAGKIKAAGMEKTVRFEAVSGDINDQIDDAYRQKYSSSSYLNSMISERAKAATVRVY